MIAKIQDNNRPLDPRNQAGLAAEQKMAFYLRRAFEHESEVWVFNDLRLAQNGDAAQIDHLVLHRSGMVLVESKSVTGEIAVNKRDEWTRRANGSTQGMESPVTQAKLQAQFLQRLLRQNSERLLDKQLGLQIHFNKYWPIDIMVAVSDTGRISRDMKVPELMKADHVADAAQAIIRSHVLHRHSPNPLSSDATFVLKPVEIGRLVQFLLSSHTPIERTNATASVAQPHPPSAPAPSVDSAQPAYDRDVFGRLRALRKRLADERNIAAYMVFTDATLRLMAATLPKDSEELLRIPGVGPKKVEEYGPVFLLALKDSRYT